MSKAEDGLLHLTAALVDIESVSHDEDELASFVAAALGSVGHLETTRIGSQRRRAHIARSRTRAL